MNNKRAAIEIQFNWIFIVIVGAILFLFIISLVFNQKKSADTQLTQDVLKKISSNIKGKQQLTNTFSQIETIKTSYVFSCDPETLISDFKIANAQREQLPLEIIFTPREFTAQKIDLLTLDFNVPFTVTRFIYISPSNMIFIIYNASENQEYSRDIYDALPNVNKKFVDSESALANILKSYNTYRVICFKDSCPRNYNYINIEPSIEGNVFSYGSISYNSRISRNSVNYFGKESLLGAIYSDNQKYYLCQMNRALKQFELKRQLYEKRIEILQREFQNTNSECYNVLVLPLTTLRNMENKGLEDSKDLYELSNRLKNDNTDLLFRGCPLIY